MPRRSEAGLPDHPQAPDRPSSVRVARAVRPVTGHSPAVSDRFFRYIVSSMRNGVIAIRRDGTLALMNEEGYRIFGLTRSPADQGRHFGEVFRDRPDVVRVLSGAFELTTLPNRAELRLRDLDRVIGYTLSVVKNDEGFAVGAVLFFKDLTQVEQQEERERLRDRLASLGEMAAGIAHELKNPLAGIEVMAGLLRRQVGDSADAQSLLADIINEAKLANAIVVEMLQFVRPIRLQVERVDIGDVLRQALTLAESKAMRGAVKVNLDAAGRLPAVHGDPYQLCQVFTNLLTNAFEALDGRGNIGVSVVVQPVAHLLAVASEASGSPLAMIVDVADDGPGVSEEMRDRIFNPFFTTKPQGSGLGLPIVRKIIDAHDGRIDLTSVPGHGTRFRVTLPVSEESRIATIGSSE